MPEIRIALAVGLPMVWVFIVRETTSHSVLALCIPYLGCALFLFVVLCLLFRPLSDDGWIGKWEDK